ncbi:MAG: RrF2 family transcriptional regulator [Eubacteriales bacterium]|nr:RrF2 family transcriptional regulator [Eubacteriales bacterium]
MIISTRGRYALRVMVELAQRTGDGYVPLKEIAEHQDISEKYLENVIKVLVQNGFLEGLRGKGGGYRLTREPKDYTLGGILRLAEGSLASVACTEDSAADCPRRNICPSRPVWQKLDQLINGYLDGITLADLLETDGEL